MMSGRSRKKPIHNERAEKKEPDTVTRASKTRPTDPSTLLLPDRAYWVVPGAFMAGAYPGSKDADETRTKLGRLLDCGVRHVISLMEAHETDHSGEAFVAYDGPLSRIAEELCTSVSCTRVPIRDLGVPSPETMISILNEIDRTVATGRGVYVHCWGGRGRTGTVVGCYLVRHGLDGEEALRRVKELRRPLPDADMRSPETTEQCDMVRGWAMMSGQT